MRTFHLSKKQSFIFLAIVLLLLIVGTGAYMKRSGLHRRYEAYMLKRELSQQLIPLKSTLESLGFTGLQLKSECSYLPTGSKANRSDIKLQCTASTKKYLVVGSGKDVTARLEEDSAQLSKQLNANGWKQRRDYPTIAWFKAIAGGVDYQPDQLNVKQLNDMTCTIDFFTAFSKPAQPAINLLAQCYKPKFDIQI